MEKGNYHGVFNVWYDNGNLQVNGQTKDGEMDGSWKQFYQMEKGIALFQKTKLVN